MTTQRTHCCQGASRLSFSLFTTMLVDISKAFRPEADKDKGGAYCLALLCTSFCEILLTDFPIS